MSLLHPTMGEICDRWCVCLLRVRALRDRGATFADVDSEIQELRALMPQKNGKTLLQLYFVNERIWEALDEMHDTARWRRLRIAKLATRAAALNRERAECVCLLNAEAGDAREDAKLYGRKG
ncbi:MAG: hypothetical protein KGL39_28995 [Patescibacteria group bacterium]|nr:hypothetical protein [Patescibacteria group bacterium]